MCCRLLKNRRKKKLVTKVPKMFLKTSTTPQNSITSNADLFSAFTNISCAFDYNENFAI